MSHIEPDEKFTSVPNDLLEAIYKLKLNGCQSALVMAVWRYTFGFHRCQHELSAGFLAKATGFSSRAVKKEMEVLAQRSVFIILSNGDRKTNTIKINKELPKLVNNSSLVNNQSLVNNSSPTSEQLDTSLVNNSSPKKRKTKEKEEKKYSQDSQEYILSEILLNKILDHLPNFKRPDLNKWADGMDKILRIDNRSPSEVKSIIYFCQKDSFWKSNILSVDKLRAKYDQLNAKRLTEQPIKKVKHPWEI